MNRQTKQTIKDVANVVGFITAVILLVVGFVGGVYQLAKPNVDPNLPTPEPVGYTIGGQRIERIPAEGGWVYVVGSNQTNKPEVTFVPKEKK